MKKEIKEILSGITCETCSEERIFGHPPDDSPGNKYIYLDMGGNTRCYCKKHMSYCKKNSQALLNYEDDWDYPCYGAKLISDIIDI
jgi:hypothetical protein